MNSQKPRLNQGSIEKCRYWFEEAGKHMEYAIYVPTAYKPRTKIPVIVALHGLFSNPHQIIRYRGLTHEAEKRGFLVVAPFGYNDRGWYGSLGQRVPGQAPDNLGELSERDVLNVLNIVRQEFNVDDRRLYLLGHSMGGVGTLHLGATYPELWAAVAPLSPAFPWEPLAVLERLRQIPVIIVTGARDAITPVEPVRRCVDEMRRLCMDYCYKELAGGSHAAPALRADVMADIFDFFAARSRAEAAPCLSGPRILPSLSAPRAANVTGKAAEQGALNKNRQVIRMFFKVLGFVTAGTLQVELVGWSFFYSAKSCLGSVFRCYTGRA